MSDKKDLKRHFFCYLWRPYLLYFVVAPNIDTVYRLYSKILKLLFSVGYIQFLPGWYRQKSSARVMLRCPNNPKTG